MTVISTRLLELELYNFIVCMAIQPEFYKEYM